MYDKHITKLYIEKLNNLVKEEGISQYILKMNQGIEKREILEKLDNANKSKSYGKVYHCIEVMINVLENNLDIKMSEMRKILISKMKELNSTYKELKDFSEFREMKRELSEVLENNRILEQENDDIKSEFEYYEDNAEERYALLLEENRKLRELMEEKEENKLKKRILELESENENLQNILNDEGIVDIDDVDTDYEYNYNSSIMD